MLILSWHARASYKSCEALDTTIRKYISRSTILYGSQPILDGLRGAYKGSKVGPWGGLNDFCMIFIRFLDDFLDDF